MIRAALTAALVLAWAASPAAAERRDEVRARAEAGRHAARAKAYFDEGRYAEASQAYLEAYRLFPSAGLLYNLGQSYRLDGDCASASNSYRAYLRKAPRSRYRAMVTRHLETVERCAVAPEPDDAEVGSEVTAIALAGERDVVPTVLVDRPPPPGRTRKRIGLAAAGGGVVLAGIGAYFAADAMQASDEVSMLYASGASWDDVADIDQRGRRSQLISGALLAVGGLAITTGITLYTLGRRADRQAARLQLKPRSEAGVDVLLSWKF